MSTHIFPGPCVCGSYKEGGFQICCKECGSWMHGRCVKINKMTSKGIATYYCPRCRPPVPNVVSDPIPATLPVSVPDVGVAAGSISIGARSSTRTAVVNEAKDITPAASRTKGAKLEATNTKETKATPTTRTRTRTVMPAATTAKEMNPVATKTTKAKARNTKSVATAVAEAATPVVTKATKTRTTKGARLAIKSRTTEATEATEATGSNSATAKEKPTIPVVTTKTKPTTSPTPATVSTYPETTKSKRAKPVAARGETSSTADATPTEPDVQKSADIVTTKTETARKPAKAKATKPVKGKSKKSEATESTKTVATKTKAARKPAKSKGVAKSVEVKSTKRAAAKTKKSAPASTAKASTVAAGSARKRKQDSKLASLTSISGSGSATSSENPPPSKRRKTMAPGVPTTPLDKPSTMQDVPATAMEVEQHSMIPRSPVFINIIQTSRLLKLSDEVLIWILIWVHCQKSICRVSSTCKRLWSIAQDPYLWKYITLNHDTMLRRHWDTLLHPRLLSSNICELNLVGEISSPVLIDTLKLDLFTGLRTLRLEDIQTYTVYRLASKLPWLKVFEARRIKGNSDRWDWSPFRNLTQLEELLLWKNEKPMQTFSLSEEMIIETPDDVYPEDGVNGGFGGFVQLSNSNSPMMGSDDDEEGEGDDEDSTMGAVDEGGGGEDALDTDGSLTSGLEDWASVHSNQSPGAAGTGPGTGGSDDSGVSIHPLNQQQQQQQPRRTRWRMMPQLKRLALINIVSPTTHRGTDSIMRSLVSRVTTFLYWNSFNILFPVVRAQYDRLVHLTLVEPSEPAWREGTWQEHAAAFLTMKSLETITWVNPHMQRRFLIPILDVMLLSLERLRVIRLITTEEDEDTQVLQTILTHVLETQWTGQLIVLIQDDVVGEDPLVREWCAQAEESVRVANLEDAMRSRPLVFTVKSVRSEWDEDAGLKRLCLKVWEQTAY
ncbi:MAG: hypothetical protein J3R72DRAFT_158301 [Linnemannia gamsii]|nr:MAG: hypothetical protein J3R72DRAFT_158301 [Linnemannia gamsii]